MRTLNGFISNNVSNFLDEGGALLESKLSHALSANQTISRIVSKNPVNSWFGLSAMGAKTAYQKAYGLGAILQCNYAVYLNDIFNIQSGAGAGTIAWFHGDFPLSWLATEVDVSLGSLESESFYAGSHQCNYITQQSSDTIEVTFIETHNAVISNSFTTCKKLAAPLDGTIKEPKRYTFELIIAVFGNQRDLNAPIFEQRHLVSVKEASFSLSSTGRTEIVKVQVTFQKIRPHGLFKNSMPLVEAK